MVFINDVLLQHHDAKARSHREKVKRLLSQCLIRKGQLDLYFCNEISDEWGRYYDDYSLIWEHQKKDKKDLYYLLVRRFRNLENKENLKRLDNIIWGKSKLESGKIGLSVKRLMRFMDDKSQRDSSKPNFFLE